MELTQWLLLGILLVLILFVFLFFNGHTFISFGLNQTKYKIRLVGHQNKELAQAKRLAFVNQIYIDNEEIYFYESNKQRYNIPIGDVTTVSIKNDYDKVFDKRYWVRITYNLGRTDLIYTKVQNTEKNQLNEKEINYGPSYQTTLFFFSEEDEKSFFSNINDSITNFNTKIVNQIAPSVDFEKTEVDEKISPEISEHNIMDSTITPSTISEEENGVDKQIIKTLSMDLKEKAEDYLLKFINVIDKDVFYTMFDEIRKRLDLHLKGQRTNKNDDVDMFLDGELLPFIAILQEKNLFSWNNEQDILALLEILKGLTSEKLYQEFLDKSSSALTEPSVDNSNDNIISNYILFFADQSNNLANLEGLRRYLDEKGITYTSSELENKVNTVKKEKQLDVMKRKMQAQVQEDSKRSYSLEDVDSLSGEELKNFLMDLFRKTGYKVSQVKNSNFEVELIVSKGLRKVAIIAKFNSGCIGKGTLQQVLGVKNINACQEAIVITNSFFSTAAMDLAESNKVSLWDRQILKEKLQKR